MLSVEEIEAEVARLSRVEVRRVARWLGEYEADLWDRQVAEDEAAGKLHPFVQGALAEYRQGKSRSLP
jgi:hypothetical protein